MALKVQVLTISGAEYEISVEATFTVNEIKTLVEEAVGISVHDQVLLRNCTKLNEGERPFSDGDVSALTVLCVKTLQGLLNRAGLTDPFGKGVNALSGSSGYSVLMVAALLGDPKSCLLVLEDENFALINHIDNQGRTILHWAAAQGDSFTDVCGVVLSHKSFVNAGAVDSHGRTALHCAVDSGSDIICAQLLASECHIAEELLLAKDSSCGTALHLAAFGNHPSCCKAILAASSNKQSLLIERNNLSFTALHVAASRGFASCCAVLLTSAPEPEDLLLVPTTQGRCALHFAAQNIEDTCCRVLVAASSDCEELLCVKDKIGRTAVDEARASNHPKCLEFLCELFESGGTAQASKGQGALMTTKRNVEIDLLIANFQPGKVGMAVDSDTGKVMKVLPGGQADQAGVTVGMTVRNVGNSVFSLDALKAVLGGHANYQLTLSR